jgi:hypothetical protein
MYLSVTLFFFWKLVKDWNLMNIWNKKPTNSLLEESKVVYVAENPSLDAL